MLCTAERAVFGETELYLAVSTAHDGLRALFLLGVEERLIAGSTIGGVFVLFQDAVEIEGHIMTEVFLAKNQRFDLFVLGEEMHVSA